VPGHLGVLEAINKLSDSKDTNVFFNIEDEGVLKVLAQILTSILHNSLLHDDREHFYQDLLKVLEIGSVLNSQKDLKEFVQASRTQMQLLFNVSQLRVYIYNEGAKLVKFLDEKLNEFVVLPADFGIISYVLENETQLVVASAENHAEFNGRCLSLSNH
jgi:hypothetical protein